MALATGIVSCQDDVQTETAKKPAPIGSEIRFGAIQKPLEINADDGTRVHYGNYNNIETDEHGTRYYSLYWDNNDQIAIYCPQALRTSATPQQETDYKVIVNDKTSNAGVLAKINPSDAGLQWGSDEKHNFYGFFPLEAKNGAGVDRSDAANPRAYITAHVNPYQASSGVDSYYDETTKKWTHYVQPTADNIYMYAHSVATRDQVGEDGSISLEFKPILTTLEVVVNGPQEGAAPVQVSMVTIYTEPEKQQSIAGDFRLYLGEYGAADDGETVPQETGTISNQVSIPTLGNDGLPITLNPGDRIVVRAFLLPRSVDQGDTWVTVTMVNGGTRAKNLNTGTLRPKTFNIAQMPPLYSSDTNYWLTRMNENVYFSQLSIPGTHNSYNYPSTETTIVGTNDNIMTYYQTRDIENQLKAGCRAFSFQVGFANSDYKNAVTNEGWRADDGTYPLYVYDAKGQVKTLKDALTELANGLESLNNNYEKNDQNETSTPTGGGKEFVIVNITYTERGDRQNEVRRWLKEIDYTIDNHAKNSLFTNNIGETTTIGELAGKMVIFVNYQGTSYPTAYNKHTYDSNGSSQTWPGFTYTAEDAQKYVVLWDTYDENGDNINTRMWGKNATIDGVTADIAASNDRDYTFLFYQPASGNGVGQGINVWRQNLERLDNPDFTPSASNAVNATDRIKNKQNMVKRLFEKAFANNAVGSGEIGNWYINNLGGFCIVNQERSYKQNLGDGGNTVKAAEQINQAAYKVLANNGNNAAPCGIVLMNFLGESTMTNVDEEVNIYGTLLPQMIIDNNFKFPLKIKETSSGNN